MARVQLGRHGGLLWRSSVAAPLLVRESVLYVREELIVREKKRRRKERRRRKGRKRKEKRKKYGKIFKLKNFQGEK
jgi:hypothetical protein